MNEFEKFKKIDEFVKTIDLDRYREEYASIKIVEADLPRDIQALDTIYKYYWDEIDFDKIPDFDQYYCLYSTDCSANMVTYRDKIGMCPVCFNKGIKARIYRTWASLITQIHGGYVAQKVFGDNSLEMSTQLDHKGIDFRIKVGENTLNIQVKKESKRPEARIERISKKDIEIIDIKYYVPQPDDFKFPLYRVGPKKGTIKPKMLDFIKFNAEEGILDRYDNGFVVFLESVFNEAKEFFEKK